MSFGKIMAAVIGSYMFLFGIVFIYIKLELINLRRQHKVRTEEIFLSPKYMALDADMQYTFKGYIIKNMNRSDRRRIMFQVLRVLFLTVGGAAPIFAIITEEVDLQKILNAISSLAVLFLGVLEIEKFSVEHRRAGHMIDAIIQEWRAGIGDFNLDDKDENFRQLMRRVREILDTTESSFIGSGVKGIDAINDGVNKMIENQDLTLTQIGRSPPQPSRELSMDEVGEMFSDETPQERPVARPSPPESMGQPESGAEPVAEPSEYEMPEISQVRSTPVAPEDFGAWQAEAINLTDYEEVVVSQIRG